MTTASDPDETERLQQDLVDLLIRRGAIRSGAVELAFRAVPRHHFLPSVAPIRVYRDEVIALKREGGEAVSSSSQPAMMAIMLEQLDLRPGQRVLEIGAGSGYNAALIAHIVGPAGHVVTVDIDTDMTRHARRCLHQAGFDTVKVVTGDGGLGYAPGAPYDRIILTVAAWDILPAWREQLAPAGRLVLPLALYGAQKSVALAIRGDLLQSLSVTDCSFMRLRGPFAGPEQRISLESAGHLSAEIVDDRRQPPLALAKLLHSPYQLVPTADTVSLHDLFGPLWLWFALHDLLPCRLRAVGQATELIPALIAWPGDQPECSGMGVYAAESLCLLSDSYAAADPDHLDWQRPFQLSLRCYGAVEPLCSRVRAALAAWIARGRPESRNLQLMIYPGGTSLSPAPNTFVIPKQWSMIRLNWS